MLILDLNNNDKGQLFTQKTYLSNGLFLNIKNSISNKLSLQTKQIAFTHLSFNRNGDRFLTCDLQGSIFMFDLSYNRYLRLNRLGITCTALAYNLKCKTEYLVACIDGTIKCFNTETKDLVGWMKGHEKAIVGLSVHPTNADMCISFSCDFAQLWDLKTFECKQKLSINAQGGNNHVEIVKICFAPFTNDIVSVFKDDTIFVWSGETIALKSQFNVSNEKSNDAVAKHFYKCFSVSSDGKTLVTGSRNNYFHVWDIEKKEFMKKVDLEPGEHIKDCLIIPGPSYDNKLLIVLTNEGTLNVYNLESGKVVANLNSNNISHNQSQLLKEQKINQIYCSPNSRYLCCITSDGCVQCFDFDFSNLKSLKVTSSLMKSSINSTSSFVKASNRTQEYVNAQLKDLRQNAASKEQTNLLDNKVEVKLFKILKCFNEYPARYRMFIWKIILKLPENYESYSYFIKKGMHSSFLSLAKKYPLKSQKSIRMLQCTLSALAHWSPILAECEYLPVLVFPFVKLFQNNQVICFEIIATLLKNWCLHWFDFFPNPPMNILNMIENLLAYHDKLLLEHFVRYRITCVIYGWSLLETMFSEVLNKTDWQVLFDNLFSNHPGFLLYLVASYSICNRNTLMIVKDIEDAKYFYQHQNSVNITHLIREACKMSKTTPDELDPCKLLNDFEPLTKGTYPVFNKRPNYISDYQKNEKSKILQQELDYLKERENQLESHKFVESKKLDNEFCLKQIIWNNDLNLNNENEDNEFVNNLDKFNIRNNKSEFLDRYGNSNLRKLKEIEENYEDLENLLKGSKNSIKKSNTEEMSLEDGGLMDENKINKCLNDQSQSLLSNELSWERDRKNIEKEEEQMMKKVYALRKHIAVKSRQTTSFK